MRRREFVATTMKGAAGVSAASVGSGTWPGGEEFPIANAPADFRAAQSLRSLFPRLEAEVFINGAGGTPLARFAEEGIMRYLDVVRLGPGDGRGQWWGETWSGVRGRFAKLVGASESEIGLVECTKAGEQLVLDRLPALRAGGNVVTNDLHFGGSLHNLEGLRRSGLDVRIVKSQDFAVSVERMADSIDENTALVAVSLVSNINGHIEQMSRLAEVAHLRGAVVFADVIQAAGIVPIDVKAMGIDVAACSSYKWLFGIHGAGFLYVSEELQGTVIPDTLFPGHALREYEPFAQGTSVGGLSYSARSDADRYRPGHVNYLGYAAVHGALAFIEEIGVAELQAHSVRLNQRLLEQLSRDDYEVLSSDVDQSPILALAARDFGGLRERLIASDVVVSIGGDKWDLVRISPAIYNTEADMDRLAEVLAG